MYFDAKPPKLLHVSLLVPHGTETWAYDLLNLIEDHAARLIYPEEPNDSCNHGEKAKKLPVRAWQIEDVVVLDAVRSVIFWLFNTRGFISPVWSLFAWFAQASP